MSEWFEVLNFKCEDPGIKEWKEIFIIHVWVGPDTFQNLFYVY